MRIWYVRSAPALLYDVIVCGRYLLGRQVVADSTIEGYVEALRRGCRCLERE